MIVPVLNYKNDPSFSLCQVTVLTIFTFIGIRFANLAMFAKTAEIVYIFFFFTYKAVKSLLNIISYLLHSAVKYFIIQYKLFLHSGAWKSLSACKILFLYLVKGVKLPFWGMLSK